MVTRLVMIFAVACLVCAGVVRSPEAEDQIGGGFIGLRHIVDNATPGDDMSDGLLRSFGNGTPEVQYSRSWLLYPAELGGAIPEPALIILFGMSILIVLHRVRRTSFHGSAHVDVTPRSTAQAATPIRFLDPAA